MVITLVSQQFHLAEGVGGILDTDTAAPLVAEGPIDAGGPIAVAMQRPASIIAVLYRGPVRTGDP
jgi:hypothetical protein